MNLNEAYSYSVQFLNANNVDEAENKALNIVCHIDGIHNSEFPFHKDDFIKNTSLADMLWRLKSGEPLQYVLGKWDFYESEFYVGEGVLIPRPETEELVELAINRISDYDSPVVYDLCSGSGCIGISIAKAVKSSKVFCIEKSDDALFYLNKNAINTCNATVIKHDIFYDIDLPQADLIISNPPYIKTDIISTLQEEVKREPVMALDGGADGLDFYRVINDKWSSYLKNDGLLILEIGDDQGKSIKNVLNNYSTIDVLKDLNGNDRMVVAKR